MPGQLLYCLLADDHYPDRKRLRVPQASGLQNRAMGRDAIMRSRQIISLTGISTGKQGPATGKSKGRTSRQVRLHARIVV